MYIEIGKGSFLQHSILSISAVNANTVLVKQSSDGNKFKTRVELTSEQEEQGVGEYISEISKKLKDNLEQQMERQKSRIAAARGGGGSNPLA